MTTDEMCLELTKQKLIKIDFKRGFVYSKRFANRKIGCLNLKGYVVATLHLNGERKQIKLHRLIWIAKNGLIPKGLLLDHRNRIKSDNRLRNLRIGNDKLNASNRRSYFGESNPYVKLNERKVKAIRMDYKSIKSYKKISIKYKVSKSLIAQIIQNKIWKQN